MNQVNCSFKKNDEGWNDSPAHQFQDPNLLKKLQNNLNRYEEQNKKSQRFTVPVKSTKTIKLPLLTNNISNKNIKFVKKKELYDVQLKQSVPIKIKTVMLNQNDNVQRHHRRLRTFQKIGESQQNLKNLFRKKVTVKFQRIKEINSNFNEFSDHKFFQETQMPRKLKSKMLV